jgi:DUF438 domain-containing protein
MSELIDNTAKRIGALTDFSRRLINGVNGKALIEMHQQVISSITPQETMQVLDNLLLDDYPFETVKANVGKLLSVFHKSLSAYHWDKPTKGHFLYYMMLENREVEKIMANLKQISKLFFNGQNQDISTLTRKFRLLIDKLKLYELHYTKKENVLFPYIEKALPQFRCLQLMWSFHDDFRKSLKALDNILIAENPERTLLNKELGKLFFTVLPIVFREEQIVFPVALRAIPEKYWNNMIQESNEIGWSYIEIPTQEYSSNLSSLLPSGNINLGSGSLNPAQLILLLNNLPVDITFVDENDEVKYFSDSKHRIFPRSNAIIGRKVQNCHPPESVHVVTEIISAFRNKSKDHADFWIQMKDHFIYIRYFALYNEQGEYWGTMEVSQDVTEIRNLSGEQRLLDWS